MKFTLKYTDLNHAETKPNKIYVEEQHSQTK